MLSEIRNMLLFRFHHYQILRKPLQYHLLLIMDLFCEVKFQTQKMTILNSTRYLKPKIAIKYWCCDIEWSTSVFRLLRELFLYCNLYKCRAINRIHKEFIEIPEKLYADLNFCQIRQRQIIFLGYSMSDLFFSINWKIRCSPKLQKDPYLRN